MKFLMIYRQEPSAPPPTPEQLAALGSFTQEMIKSGTVVMTGGIVRPGTGTQVALDGDRFLVTDGPFAETKELIDGYAIVEAKSKAEALALSERFMKIAGEGKGEILALFDPGGPG